VAHRFGPSFSLSLLVFWPHVSFFLCNVGVGAGSRVAMADLVVGARVRVGAASFSDVFMFTHSNAEVQASFVTLVVAGANQSLQITAGHYLYVNGRLQTARTVRVGDAVQTSAGVTANVSVRALVRSNLISSLYMSTHRSRARGGRVLRSGCFVCGMLQLLASLVLGIWSQVCVCARACRCAAATDHCP
jgi:hypothetical protein